MGAIIETKPVNSIAGLGAMLAAKISQLSSVVASQVTPEKMCRIALNELRLNDYLAKTAMGNPDSLFSSIMAAAHLGLEIGGALGQAYLVPYGKEIKLIVGYRGLLTLSRRSGFITSIKAEMVYENDEFSLELGLEPKLVHKPLLTGERGAQKLVYMVAQFKDGGYHLEWMTMADVNGIRDRSAAVKSAKANGKTTPWDTDPVAMALKTVIRRGWKYLPMSIEMQKTEIIEHAAETGQSLVIDGDSQEIELGEMQEGVADNGDSTLYDFTSIKAVIFGSKDEAELSAIHDEILNLDDENEINSLMKMYDAKRAKFQAAAAAKDAMPERKASEQRQQRQRRDPESDASKAGSDLPDSLKEVKNEAAADPKLAEGNGDFDFSVE